MASARPHAQPERDVFEDGQVLEQRVVLEHEADAPVLHALMRGGIAAKMHVAGIRHLQPRDHAQHRRLARSRRSEDADELAGRDLDRDAVQHRLRAKAVADALQRDAHSGNPSCARCPPAADCPARQSTICRPTRLSSAMIVSTDATANAAVKSYSL
jgi:hypothetical protein